MALRLCARPARHSDHSCLYDLPDGDLATVGAVLRQARGGVPEHVSPFAGIPEIRQRIVGRRLIRPGQQDRPDGAA